MTSDETIATEPTAVSDADSDLELTERVLAETSGWLWRVPTVVAVAIAGLWIAAVFIGIGERRARRDLAAMPSPLANDHYAQPNSALIDPNSQMAKLEVLAGQLENATLYGAPGAGSGFLLWGMLPPDEDASLRDMLRNTAPIVEKLDTILAMAPGAEPVRAQWPYAPLKVSRWLSFRMQGAASRSDWLAVDADLARLLAVASLPSVGESWPSLCHVEALLAVTRIVERYGAVIPEPHLLGWRDQLAAIPQLDLAPIIAQGRDDDNWIIASEASNRTRGVVDFPEYVDVPRPFIGNAAAINYTALRERSAVAYQDAMDETRQVVAEGRYSRLGGRTYVRGDWIGDLTGEWGNLHGLQSSYNAHNGVIVHFRLEISRHLALAAIDATVYQRRHGHWPPDLAALDADRALIADPHDFALRPYKMRVDKLGCLRIYSVGYRGVDDGGLTQLDTGDLGYGSDVGLDMGIRLVPVGWLPADPGVINRPDWLPPILWPELRSAGEGSR